MNDARWVLAMEAPLSSSAAQQSSARLALIQARFQLESAKLRLLASTGELAKPRGRP